MLSMLAIKGGRFYFVSDAPFPPTTCMTASLNQYSHVGTTSYTYDANGNLTFDGVNTYTYDAENHLVSATGPFGTATYTSDAFGRRITKTVNGTTTRFTWDGDQLLEELDTTNTQLAEYLNGPGIDEPLRMERGSVKTYFLADGLGSILGLTDPQGKIVESYTYDPYGKPSIFDATGAPLAASAYGNRLLFTGREYDTETGTYYYRARTYNAFIGRFHQRDPLTWGPDDPRVFAAQNLQNHSAWLIQGLLFTPGEISDSVLSKLGEKMVSGIKYVKYAVATC